MTSRKDLEAEALKHARQRLDRPLTGAEKDYVKAVARDMHAGTMNPAGDCIPEGWSGNGWGGAVRRPRER